VWLFVSSLTPLFAAVKPGAQRSLQPLLSCVLGGKDSEDFREFVSILEQTLDDSVVNLMSAPRRVSTVKSSLVDRSANSIKDLNPDSLPGVMISEDESNSIF
jgi:hypothetical protein